MSRGPIGALLASAALLGWPSLASAAEGPVGATSGAGSAITTPGSTTTAPATGVTAATTPAVGSGKTLPTATSTAIGTARPSARPSSGGSLSNEAIAAAVVGSLLLLAALLWGVFRWGAFEPHWLLTLRHSLAEAGFRLSATAAELGDWARLGR